MFHMTEADFQMVLAQTPRAVAVRLGISVLDMSPEEILAAIESADSVAYRTLMGYLNIYREWWEKSKELSADKGNGSLRDIVNGLSNQRDTWRKSLVLYFGDSIATGQIKTPDSKSRGLALSAKAKTSLEMIGDDVVASVLRSLGEISKNAPGPDDKELIATQYSNLWYRTSSGLGIGARVAILYRIEHDQIYVVDILTSIGSSKDGVA